MCSSDLRYQSAALMREDLLRAARGQQVEATPVLASATTLLSSGSTAIDEPGQRRAGLVYGLFGLLLLGVVLATALLVHGVLSDGSGLVDTPSVVGLSQQDAAVSLAEVGLTVGHVTTRFDDKPLGTVLEQAPVAGILVDETGTVDLAVSQGVEMTLVPRVRQLSQEDAEVELQDAKLSVGQVVTRDGPVEPGLVLRVIPQEGTELAAGQTVTLVVSSGEVDVPFVIGQSEQEGEDQLQQAGFNVGVRLVPDLGPAGRVLSQDPGGGTAQLGSTVIIEVSQKAPSPSPTPSPLPLPVPDLTDEPTVEPEPSMSTSPTPSTSPTGSSSPSPTATPTGTTDP